MCVLLLDLPIAFPDDEQQNKTVLQGLKYALQDKINQNDEINAMQTAPAVEKKDSYKILTIKYNFFFISYTHIEVNET